MNKTMLLIMVSILFLVGCAKVSVVKTAKGYFEPTKADDVDILVYPPKERSFTELAAITSWKWDTLQIAKMHNSLRAKSAPLGADAVILGSSGVDSDGYYWASGVAIKYKD